MFIIIVCCSRLDFDPVLDLLLVEFLIAVVLLRFVFLPIPAVLRFLLPLRPLLFCLIVVIRVLLLVLFVPINIIAVLTEWSRLTRCPEAGTRCWRLLLLLH